MKELLVINVKMKLLEFDKCDKKDITYDWDAGHCYSSIKSDIYNELLTMTEDHPELEDHVMDYCNEWLYNNDECPPCAIHVNKDGTSGQGCCYDSYVHTVDETNDIIDQLTQHCKDNDCMSSIPYLISRE